MGSELISKGEKLPQHIWSAHTNITNPRLIYSIHKDYVNAGSEYLTTNTFRTTPRAYKKIGLSNSEAINSAHDSLKIAVKVARDAGNKDSKILGSIAPLEDCYKPDLFPGEDTARYEFNQISKWLDYEGVDKFLLETMNSIIETRVCLESLSTFNIPIWVSFVLKSYDEILSGEKLAKALKILEAYNVECVLLNCNSLDKTFKAINILDNYWNREWGIYPNLGIGEPSPDGIINEISSDDEFLRLIKKSIELGGTILGGCCGSTTQHIKLISNYIINKKASN